MWINRLRCDLLRGSETFFTLPANREVTVVSRSTRDLIARPARSQPLRFCPFPVPILRLRPARGSGIGRLNRLQIFRLAEDSLRDSLKQLVLGAKDRNPHPLRGLPYRWRPTGEARAATETGGCLLTGELGARECLAVFRNLTHQPRTHNPQSRYLPPPLTVTSKHSCFSFYY